MTEQESSAELAAILAVIRRETSAFWDKDFDAWADCWAHVPYTRTMGYWPLGGVSVVEGWDAQSALIRRMMAENPRRIHRPGWCGARISTHTSFADAAWITFDQYAVDTGDPVFDMPGRSRETRILERHDGQWKIVYTGWLLEGTPEASLPAAQASD